MAKTTCPFWAFSPGIALSDSEPDTVVIHTAFLKFQRFGLLFLLERGSTPLGKKSSKAHKTETQFQQKRVLEERSQALRGGGALRKLSRTPRNLYRVRAEQAIAGAKGPHPLTFTNECVLTSRKPLVVTSPSSIYTTSDSPRVLVYPRNLQRTLVSQGRSTCILLYNDGKRIGVFQLIFIHE